MTKERIYKVTFDTQKDRRYISWEVFVPANNQKDAKERAYVLWEDDSNPHQRTIKHARGYTYSVHPHMFHTAAQRADVEESGVELCRFFAVENRFANWGYRG
jgi:hypothetical protein